ncbi:MAG: glycosyltransferase family 39 protein, partial [Deltaproteobacteria bacterium]|nr:glycosyltransferase family 39 protein [Deltaproteobacteria bacterium]
MSADLATDEGAGAEAPLAPSTPPEGGPAPAHPDQPSPAGDAGAAPPPGEVPDPEGDSVVPDPALGAPRTGLAVVAGLLVLATLFGLLRAGGIWDPHELRTAELARRIAVALLGAAELVAEGAENTVPTASELGRGELPFTSVAIGLRLGGLGELSGRLPMALYGLAGILATSALLARLADRVTALFAAIVLVTCPLYFVQARTVLGDVASMASVAVAAAGLGLATLDVRLRPASRAGLALL